MFCGVADNDNGWLSPCHHHHHHQRIHNALRGVNGVSMWKLIIFSERNSHWAEHERAKEGDRVSGAEGFCVLMPCLRMKCFDNTPCTSSSPSLINSFKIFSDVFGQKHHQNKEIILNFPEKWKKKNLMIRIKVIELSNNKNHKMKIGFWYNTCIK